MTLTEQKMGEYRKVLQDLVNAARQDGIVLSIEKRPCVPGRPKMGDYYLVAEVDLAKELYRGNP